MGTTWLSWLFFGFYLLCLPFANLANQVDSLNRLLKSSKYVNTPSGDLWPELVTSKDYTSVYLSTQDGQMEADKMGFLPGQPKEVNLNQYSGYVTVDVDAGRALFYYFVESPKNSNSSTTPLLLWLNGGPGCSSVGYGAMEELGPFRVNSDCRTLYSNPYAWNNVANVLFLDSPAGVGYSYSNTTSDYLNSGDKITARDSYRFLINWLERFPQYKTRDFYIAGESYAGHYVPQLAYTILVNNRNTTHTVINLQGIAIGNALIDDYTTDFGAADYYWSHALNSDETYAAFHNFCKKNFTSDACQDAKEQSEDRDTGRIDMYNVYAPTCPLEKHDIKHRTKGSVRHYDPCIDGFILEYLDLPEVKKAFRANLTDAYLLCSWPGKINWNDRPDTVLPLLKQLMETNIRIWLYSGDHDGRVPVTSTRYSINALKLPVKKAWRPWYTNKEVGGYVVEYEGLVFVTVRGAGHEVPTYQPERALTMISAFLQGILPPP